MTDTSPTTAPAPNNTEQARGLQWAVINDFSAGIAMTPRLVPSQQVAGTQVNAGLVTTVQKPTATLFDDTGAIVTYLCHAGNDGSLVPLPYPINPTPTPWNLVQTLNPVQPNSTIWVLGGMLIQGAFVYAIAYTAASGTGYIELWQSGTGNLASFTMGAHGTVPPPVFSSHLSSTYIVSGGIAYPGIVYHFFNTAAPAQFGFVYTSNGPTNNNLNPAGSAGWFHAHQGRILYIYNGPTFAMSTFPAASYLVGYTDPPQSLTLVFAATIFGTNNVDEITALGAISAGQLLILTSFNGGMIISGDVYSPSVTTVPGVVGTGYAYIAANLIATQPFFGQPCISPIGLVYLNCPSGAWVWNGGSNSSLLSGNLGPIFWNISGAYRYDNSRFFVGYTSNWVLFQDNWLYDIVTNGWWMLNPPNIQPGTATQPNTSNFTSVPSGNGWVVLPNFVTAGIPQNLQMYSLGETATTYQWMSNGIPVSNGQIVDIREMVVTAFNTNTNPALITITLVPRVGLQQTLETITVPATRKPAQFRMQCLVQADIVSIKINVSIQGLANQATTTPCIVNQVAIGYRPSVRVPTI